VWDDAEMGMALLPRLEADDAGASVLANAAVDGFVSICDVADDARLGALIARRLPFVMVDHRRSGARCQVVLDDRGGSRAATEHLLRLGHRRLAAVALPRSPGAPGGVLDPADPGPIRYTIMADRLAGVREAVEDAGLAWDSVPALAVPDDQSPRQAAREWIGTLLERADRPTGVVAMSDELAAGVVDAAAARGIQVPGELSVVGFDDTPTATSVAPPLTTVHQPLAARGETAARLLLEGAPARVVEFPTELVVRCSTTSAPD
jgi:DNA-binding LacI/PurR family transcriptional regulator